MARTTATVVWDDAAVQVSIEAPDGKVGRALNRLADGVVFSMKFRCPVSPPGPLHRSGELRASIRKFRQPDGSYLIGPTATTGDHHTFLGPLVERGTPPHLIVAHGPYSLHNAETGDYFGPVVHHPGTRAQPFIKPAADDLNGVVIHID